MLVADHIAQWLADNGITHSFGIIGGGNVVLWDAIARLGRTKLICVHHEQVAAMAAAYYYRNCKRLALCLVTTGAGSTNAITGVMAAYMDSVPIIVISGNEDSRYMSQPTRVWGIQGYGSSELVSSCTKKSHRLMGFSDTERELMGTLMEIALTPRKGPVWIDVPRDIQSAVA